MRHHRREIELKLKTICADAGDDCETDSDDEFHVCMFDTGDIWDDISLTVDDKAWGSWVTSESIDFTKSEMMSTRVQC